MDNMKQRIIECVIEDKCLKFMTLKDMINYYKKRKELIKKIEELERKYTFEQISKL
jgi:hypothetical protein